MGGRKNKSERGKMRSPSEMKTTFKYVTVVKSQEPKRI